MTIFFFFSHSQGWCVCLMVVFRFGKDIGSHMSLYAAGRLFTLLSLVIEKSIGNCIREYILSLGQQFSNCLDSFIKNIKNIKELVFISVYNNYHIRN